MKMFMVFVAWALVLVVGLGVLGIYEEYSFRDVLEEEVYSHLSSIAESKAVRVGVFLSERKDDLVFLRESAEVDELLESEILTDRIDEKLDFFYRTNGYLDLVLISADGRVLWSAKDKAEIGWDLASGEYKETKLGVVYGKVQNDFGVGIFDPGYYEEGERLSVFVTSPVLKDSLTVVGKKDIVGIIALRIDNLEIEQRVESDEGMDIYLVNRDGTRITSSGLSRAGSQMYTDCFQDYRNYYFERQGERIEEVMGSGLYDGVFGAHQYILETGWCVMVEMNRDEFYSSKESCWLSWVFVFLGLFILGLMIYRERGGRA